MLLDKVYKNCTVANEGLLENSKLIGVEEMPTEFLPFDFRQGKSEYSGPVVANFVDGDQRKGFMHSPCHTLVVGGTGSGKTQCYYMAQAEAIARSKNKPSVFFMDLKGEYYKTISELYEKMGYEVFVLNLKKPFSSVRYNPLDPVWKAYQRYAETKRALLSATGKEREYMGKTYSSYASWRNGVWAYGLQQLEECENNLRRLSQMFVPVEGKKEPSWEYGAREMFYQQAMGLLEDSEYPERNMTREKFTIANIVRIAHQVQDDCSAIYKWIENRKKDSEVRGLVSYYTKNAKQTREGYISTFTTKLDRWKNLSTDWITSKSEIDVEDIMDRIDKDHIAIFCIIDETRPEGYDICMAFINHLITAAKIRTDHKGPFTRDFHILADEFANMPQLPQIENRISTLRSYKVWLHMGVQSYAQLDKVYGEQVRNIIRDNCDFQISFGTNNSATVKEFTESLGHTSKPTTSYTIANDGRVNMSVGPTQTLLVHCSDLAQLRLGEAYAKVFRKPSIFTKLDPHFACPDLFHGNKQESEDVANLDEINRIRYDISLAGTDSARGKQKFTFDF
ncbi:MAG: type IV secretory system conjugative DNA transfer family protein [Clostridia bacterium]|nr:type IV secretory system conjugative DNA transfer family protein [Clostridia bacterium]